MRVGVTPVVCIDFGNSYTKVGVRWDPELPSDLVKDDALQYDDELYVCIPTAAAVVRRESGDRWFLGTDLVGVREGIPGLQVFRNWKPAFFGGSEEPEVDEVAERYFRWLRTLVDPALREFGPSFSERYVTRITLPAFGPQARSEQRLLGILERAGWRAAAAAPCVSEPVANALGIFTQGRNAVWLPDNAARPRAHTGKMLAGTPLLEVARRRYDNKYSQKMYWTLIVDLGGYTLDFAMLGFDVTSMDMPHGTHNGQRRFETQSRPLGVAALDRHVADALPETARERFVALIDASDQRGLEELHRRVYQRGRDYRLRRGGGVIGGDAVRSCIERFADEAASLTEAFIEQGQYERIDDLVLTGGGMNIPAVRDAIRLSLADISRFKHAWVAATADEVLASHYKRLEPRYVRGATALGGSTVYFDFKGGRDRDR
ncbi:MAG: hypothetical protein KTR31_14645 [Myxococcales bacterium]|nr:hypothetical protein [Myxococcales bacterium]